MTNTLPYILYNSMHYCQYLQQRYHNFVQKHSTQTQNTT